VPDQKKTSTPHNSALITGKIIKWARERLGRSQQNIADDLGSGIRAENIDDWEKEKARPDFRKAQKLATALHIPFGYLFLPEPPANDIRVPDLSPVWSVQPATPEFEMLAFRRAEFNVIREEVNDPNRIPNLRVIPAEVPSDLVGWLCKVNLVERLRETRVFYGFDRLEASTQPLVGMPQSAMAQLFRTPPPQPQDRWLPAIEVFGEGIYLELCEERITQWQQSNSEWLDSRLDDQFVNRLNDVFQTLPPLSGANRIWASRYLLVHTLSHILINQLVFECGYSTASLRERLYISADSTAPMAGILIYTAAGDSEGTLGGLVRLGRPERLEDVVRRALSRASWCSADPVCSENLGGQGSRLANLAACHACTLLPETACETVNQGLDRGMLVGTPDDRSPGWMSTLLEQVYELA
jgi:transcriptional regulator with XRE-family HTH domain